MKSIEIIKRATKYSDIFNNDEKVAKHEYREYCKLYHPDTNNSREAQEVFSIITRLYNNKHCNNVRGTVDEDIEFINIKTNKGFVLSNPVIIKTGISMIYHTATKIAIIYHKSYKDFFDNYIKNIKNLQYKDVNMQSEFKRYFPTILNTFEMKDDMLCILLDKTPDVLNLGKIVEAYKKQGELFPEKHAAWILNRLYNIVCYINYYNKAFNGLNLENIWISPEMHSVLILGGWEYTVKQGEKMIGCPKDVYKILPLKIKDTKQSNITTDLECIKEIGRILYKGHTNLEHINKFLNSGIKEGNPTTEWNEYGKAIDKQFGKRKFIIWDNVPYN